ncbi:hypothetical protein ACFPRL_29360 [Pseudoclavibacter helvolus]
MNSRQIPVEPTPPRARLCTNSGDRYSHETGLVHLVQGRQRS